MQMLACEQVLHGEREKEGKEKCCGHTGSGFRSTGSQESLQNHNKTQGRQKDIANGKIKYVNRKAIAFGQLFTLETALDIYDKGFITPKCSKTRIRL